MAATDINTIPYDAPLSFTPPTSKWIRDQTGKGKLATFFTIPDADLRGKWVIITGSNNGIGREAALQMAAWGANIILGCRDPPPTEVHPNTVVTECLVKARAAGHKETEFEWWTIDMSDLASVEAFAKRWLDTKRPLDLLCNNAGVGSSPGGSSSVFKTKDGFEFIHQVNFTSHVLLTLHLLPSVAKASKPRIVCTTSCFHYPGIYDLGNFNGEKGMCGPNGVQYYMNNKLFYQCWLTELHHRMQQHEQYKHIVVNGVHPGYVNSGIWNLNGPREVIKIGFLKWLASWIAITPQQGSLAITYAATSNDAGRQGGRYFNRINEEDPMPHVHDADARLRVWRKVNDELKLEEKGLLDVLGLRSTAATGT